MSQLTIEKYSNKSFVVRGDTKPYKDILMEYKGKWNPNLDGGGGFIFSNTQLDTVQTIIASINSGRIPTVPVAIKNNYNRSSPLVVHPVSQLPGFQAPTNLLPIVEKTQTLSYTVDKPIVGNKVIIEINNNHLETIIHQVFVGNDKMILNFNNEGHEMLVEAGVYAGEWKIPSDQRPHKIIFE